mgnify:CR=1 FL=1
MGAVTTFRLTRYFSVLSLVLIAMAGAALGWSALWIGLGLAFSGLIYLGYEHHWLGLGTTADQTSTATVDAAGQTIYNDGGSALIWTRSMSSE